MCEASLGFQWNRVVSRLKHWAEELLVAVRLVLPEIALVGLLILEPSVRCVITRVPNTDQLKVIAKREVIQADACGASIPVPKWMDTNDLTMKPARHTQYRVEIVVTEWSAHMGIQTGDIPSKISAALIELGRNDPESGTVSQVADLDIAVDIGMCPTRFPGRTRKNRREHHIVTAFDNRSVEDKLLGVIGEVL